jgi:exonuclease VII small subunit
MSAARTNRTINYPIVTERDQNDSGQYTASPYDLEGQSSRGGSKTLIQRLRPRLGEQEMSKPTFQTSEMVAEIFEPLKPARDGLAQMVKVLEPIGQVCELAEAFGPINEFQEKVASVVEPLQKLEREFNQFAGAFEPMRLLRDEMREISTTFAANVAEFAQILEPLNRLRQQLDEAVHALEPAGSLYREFSNLSSAIAKREGDIAEGQDAPIPSERTGVLRLAAGRAGR